MTTESPQADNFGEHYRDIDDLQFAINVTKEAGEYVRSALTDAVETSWKSDNTPVTNIDTTVNSLFIKRISEQYPLDRVYGEEQSAEKEGAEFTWVIDPIDGTQAIGKLDTFTICVSRLDGDGQPLMSLLYNPLRDQLFTARRGERSYMNCEPIRVSQKETIKSSYIHFGSSIRFKDLATNGIAYDRLEDQGAKIFNTRSLAYGCAEVAKGEFEGAYIGVRTPFEAATVKLIVEGAGGRVTNLYGDEVGRLDGEIQGAIVSNGRIHQALVDALLLNP